MRHRDGTSDIRSGYWRSLQELAGDEDFRRHLEAEFPAEVDATGGLSRRRFLQLMSASIAMAGLAGCRWPDEKIVPFAHRAEGTTPGEVKKFATSLELAGIAAGVVVTSYDGRPIKIEGNPAHPASLGAADLFAQARILELYDPDRSRSVVRREGHQTLNATWEDFEDFARDRFGKSADGSGLAVLSGHVRSPSLRATRTLWLERYPQARWFQYEPVALAAVHDGIGYRLDLTEARVILDLDADILGRHPGALRNARQFAASRRPDRPMSRLYVIEPDVSITGAVADHRLPFARSEMPHVMEALWVEVQHRLGSTSRLGLSGHRALRDRPGWNGFVSALAEDLCNNRGHGLVVAGIRQPSVVFHWCERLNQLLDNVDRTAIRVMPPPLSRANENLENLTSLNVAIHQGQIDSLLILDGNPVYDAPVDYEFGASLAGLDQSVHLSLYQNETSRVCSWHLPLAHPLESWGDGRSFDGTLSAVQPLIEPLYGGKTAAEVLSMMAETPPRKAHDITRRTFHQLTGGRGDPPESDLGFEKRWRDYLHAGFLADSGATPVQKPASPVGGTPPAATPVHLGPDNLELLFAPDSKLFDGRFANNGWLQELPDPMTKLTWDNAAVMSPATASELHVGHGDLVTLQFKGRQLDMPVYVLPGQAQYSVTVNLGYGRTAAGRIGDGVGFDTYQLRTSDAPWGGPGLKITRTGRKYDLACTQDHFAIDTRGAAEREKRVGPLVREGDLEHYREHPDFAQHLGVHHPPLVSLWKEHAHDGHRWAMAIDLNLCIGCNACVVACQAENNIPIVGKKQVRNGREMHWLRIDRYFQGDPERPRVAQQPVGCVHCEMAPCEQVCPVAATVHSQEGLNTMVYNRCVGTRYCSNNCPYKVRRFNFFNYQKQLSETEKMAFNPDVTVRSRGVMEKCTYCVQRIQAARIRAKNERRPLRDGDIVPACAQTCPTGAIVFGDLNDEASLVARLHADPRAYGMLAELNVKPRTAYLARIRNPNPKISGDQHGPATGHDGHG